MSNKKWIVATTVVIAAGLVFVATRGNKVRNEGTEGTIGAAKRYQSQQISSQDVQLDKPEVAAFIQSDTFRKLATDQAFREAARSASFGKFVASDQLREVSAHTDLARVLGNENVKYLIDNQAFAAAMTDASLRDVVLKADLGHIAENQRVTELLKLDALRDLALKTEFQKLADDAAKADARSIADFNRIADNYATLKTSEAFRSLEGSKYFAEALKSGVMDLFRTDASARFAIDGLRTIEPRQLTEAFRVDGFRQFIEALRSDNLAAVREISNSPDMLRVLGESAYREAAARSELGLVADAGFKEALARVTTE